MERLRINFLERLSVKTNWGRNQVMAEYLMAVTETLAESLDMELGSDEYMQNSLISLSDLTLNGKSILSVGEKVKDIEQGLADDTPPWEEDDDTDKLTTS